MRENAKLKLPQKTWEILGLTLVGLTIFYLAFTIFKPGIPSGHDISAHIIHSRLFIDNLNSGQFPVRWTEWIKNGFSQPLFNFYPVGFYYLTALVNKIVPGINESAKLSVLLSWWLGGLFAFLFLRRFGNIPAAAGAVIFTFTPYLISDVFVRAAYPEILAISFSMGVLWALDRLLKTALPVYGFPLAIFLSVVIFSHLPTLVIMTPIISGYVLLLMVNQEVNLKGLLLAAASTVLAIGIAAFYIVPANYELNLIKSELLTSDYYDFHPHFVYPEQLFSLLWGYGISQEGPNDGMSFQFGLIQWGIILITLLLVFFGKFAKKEVTFKSHLIFWLLALFFAVFFMHETSLSFWENIKAISFIQYPWRFLMVVAFASASLCAILVSKLLKKWQQSAALLAVILAVLLLYSPYLHPATFLPNDYFNDVVNVYLEEGYLPKNVEELPKKQVGKWEIIKGQGDIEEKQMRSHLLSFVVKNKTPLILRINTHYFPGWKAFLDNQEIQIDSSNSFGFMDITVLAGIHKIEVKFTNTAVRSLSNTVSVFSLLILSLWQLFAILTKTTIQFYAK